jgi:hypothetical protein
MGTWRGRLKNGKKWWKNGRNWINHPIARKFSPDICYKCAWTTFQWWGSFPMRYLGQENSGSRDICLGKCKKLTKMTKNGHIVPYLARYCSDDLRGREWFCRAIARQHFLLWQLSPYNSERLVIGVGISEKYLDSMMKYRYSCLLQPLMAVSTSGHMSVLGPSHSSHWRYLTPYVKVTWSQLNTCT